MAESGPSSRYHHYVPQFILRNWAHTYRPTKGKFQEKDKSKSIGATGKDRLFRGDKVLNCINLGGLQPELVEKKVARTFGIQDLYLDAGKTGKEQHVEELISRLEAKAAEVVTKIKKAFEKGDKEVALFRSERDVVRKFLFIMKYRGTTFSKRFVGDGPEDYVADDRESFIQYMEKRGFKKPIEVWLDNIQAFIDIEMDVERKWTKILEDRCYPPDARWFALNANCFFFEFFALSREHVAEINCILLEEAIHTGMIVFNSNLSACKVLEYYLTVDTGNDAFNFKQVTQKADDPRRLYLNKLQEAVILLGGNNVDVKYHSMDEPLRDYVFELISGNGEARNIYNKLSQKTVLDPKDFEQARIMLKLRVKIDTWSRGLDESIREDARDNLPRRFMFNGKATILTPQGAVLDSQLPAVLLPGPEDLVAKLLHWFVPEKQCRVMFFAAFNHRTEINPNFGRKSKEFASDNDMMRRVSQEKALVFGSQGSICDCGVPYIEKLSRRIRHAFRTKAFPSFGEMEMLFSAVLKPEEKIELATRLETMDTLPGKVKGKGKRGQSGEEENLLGLLFHVVYSIFGRK